jgi:hypothetical protein
VDRAVGERLRERIVDKAMLFDEGEPGEPRAHDGNLEVVAATGPVDDGDG